MSNTCRYTHTVFLLVWVKRYSLHFTTNMSSTSMISYLCMHVYAQGWRALYVLSIHANRKYNAKRVSGIGMVSLLSLLDYSFGSLCSKQSANTWHPPWPSSPAPSLAKFNRVQLDPLRATRSYSDASQCMVFPWSKVTGLYNPPLTFAHFAAMSVVYSPHTGPIGHSFWKIKGSGC